MKKIALASAAMGGVALITFGASGTFAAFSDVTTQDVSSVASGSVVVSSWEKTTAEMGSTQLNPGQSVVRTFYVQNTGTTTGTPRAQVLSVTDVDDKCTSNSEKATNDDCWNPNEGDLDDQIEVGFATFDPVGTDCNVPARQQYAPLGRLTDIINTPAGDGSKLKGGDAVCVAFQLTFASTGTAADNKAQGDSFTAQIQFGLEQATS